MILHLKSENAICAGFAADGYLVIMPDYIGLGKGDKFHLYQNSESEAVASIDMLLAIQKLNTTYQQQLTDEYEAFSLFMN